MYQGLYSWLDERLHLHKIKSVITEKTVPVHRHTVWYYLGGMTLFLFVIQFVTGILLLFYYKPTAEEAFESVQYIMAEVHFGWLIRSIHSWAANLLMFVIFLHLVSVFFLRAYRKPREITWISGCILFFIAIGFGFTGYLLPWNVLSFFATAVGTDISGSLPLIGEQILIFLRGGETITGATLTRFFAIHVWVLPVFLMIFIGLHLYLVQTHGMSVPLGEQKKTKGSTNFYPNFLLRDMVGWLVAVGLLAFLAALFPWELGEKANPLAPAPEGIKPEWYFLFMFQVLKIIPSTIGPFEGDMIGLLMFTIGAILLIFIPFFDRKAERGEPNLALMGIGILVLLFIVGMTIWGIFD
ncbi:MAG TPA: cytochrome b N-terminal domain-containing protein [Thermodesulfobacteriota bacterium]|nr:cytochrome b N-terminal domain-containing protein [Thermodesulfobacteriota bacterium]